MILDEELFFDIINNKKILYKIYILLWCQKKIFTIMLNPYMRQVEIRDKFCIKLNYISAIQDKLDNPVLKKINDNLDLKILSLSRQLYYIPSKL
jgi:hypothetical protein